MTGIIIADVTISFWIKISKFLIGKKVYTCVLEQKFERQGEEGRKDNPAGDAMVLTGSA